MNEGEGSKINAERGKSLLRKEGGLTPTRERKKNRKRGPGLLHGWFPAGAPKRRSRKGLCPEKAPPRGGGKRGGGREEGAAGGALHSKRRGKPGREGRL